MGFPDTDLANQWTDGEFLNQAKLNPRIDVNLNLLAQRLRAIGGNQFAGHQTVANAAAATGWVLATGMFADIDPAAGFSTGTNLWTVPTGGTGLYDISAQACMNTGGTGRARTGVGIGINGSLTPSLQAVYPPVTAGVVSMACLPPNAFALTAGQTVGLLLYHDASTNVGSTVSGPAYSFLRISRVS